MKIAIRGHKLRGKEVIQILESLGGKNLYNWCGNGDILDGFFINNDGIIEFDNIPKGYKFYTLEEFEKEFPFKVGDRVKHISSIGIIKEYCYINNKPAYKVKSAELGIIVTMPAEELKLYKEMKEERNITLTLDKAKEWYKKGGELREIALQAFTKEELTKVELPRTWEEFCENYPIQAGEAIIDKQTSEIHKYHGIVARGLISDKNICPSQKSAEAHLAMIQLEQLRDCWRQGWVPTPGDSYYTIKFGFRSLSVYSFCTVEFLSFPTREMAEEFLECFRDLIEKAGDLI